MTAKSAHPLLWEISYKKIVPFPTDNPTAVPEHGSCILILLFFVSACKVRCVP